MSAPGRLLLLLPLLSLLLVAPGCGGGGEHEITEVRKVDRVDPVLRRHRTARERFRPRPAHAGGGGMPGTAGPAGAPTAWSWLTPKGWKQKPASGMRKVSMEVPGDPPADLGVFVLPPSGMLQNVNRWRGQMGLPPATDKDLAGMAYQVRGQPALLADLRGSYKDSGRKQRFLGLLKTEAGQLLSVKLIGEEAVVDANEERFHAFVQSLRPKGTSAGAGAAGHPDVGGSATGRPPGDEGALRGKLRWKTPEGWHEVVGARGARVATFRIDGAPDLDVRINSLSGSGGGVPLVAQMWASMAGRGAPAKGEIDGFERLSVLGTKGVLMDFRGKRVIEDGGAPVEVRLLGLMCPLGGKTLFVKTVGPAAQVDAARTAFRALCQSLRIEE